MNLKRIFPLLYSACRIPRSLLRGFHACSKIRSEGENSEMPRLLAAGIGIFRVLPLYFIILFLTACGDTSSEMGATQTPLAFTDTPAPPTATQIPTSTNTPQPTFTETSIPTPTLTPIVFDADFYQASDPAHDPYVWFISHGLVEEPGARSLDAAPDYVLDEVHTFFVSDPSVAEGLREIDANLHYVNDVVAMWFESDISVRQKSVVEAADRFANDIYPTVRFFFGEEWAPGMDNDSRLHILHVKSLPGAGGYFDASSEFPQTIFSESNEREMFVISMDDFELGGDSYLAVLTHEFQHMIQWNTDANEHGWVDEGLAQLAERMVGFDQVDTRGFLNRTDTQLNSWGQSALPDEAGHHYGASYLFMLYLWERLGDDVVRLLSRHPFDSFEALDLIIADDGLSVNDLFSDWIVANYLDDTSIVDGRYGYAYETLSGVCPRQTPEEFPALLANEMPQYSAQYIEINGEGDFDIEFSGITQVGAIPDTAHSGEYMWWSGRGDRSNMTMTRAFELTGLTKATLQFWTWYDIQAYLDYGLISVSQDNGESWEILRGPRTVYDPILDEFPMYTGISGSGGQPTWALETIDLSAYVGGEILIQFEYVTDTYHARAGWAIDDISIPEIGYFDDAETEDDGWISRGFKRMQNNLPQSWAVHLISYGETPKVQTLDVSETGKATTTFSHDNQDSHTTLIVGAMAPRTRSLAAYELAINGPQTALIATNETDAEILFADDFSDPCSGWLMFDDEIGAMRIENGELVIESKSTEFIAESALGGSFDDVVIDVDVDLSQLSNPGFFGLACRVGASGNSYEFIIDKDAYYSIWAFIDGDWQALKDYTYLGKELDRNEDYHMKVSCVGDTLSLTLNEELIAEVTDTQLIAGDIKLLAATDDPEGMSVAFDNFVVQAGEQQGVILTDDFSNSTSGWEIFRDNNSEMGYEDGRYFVEVSAANWFVPGQSNRYFDDVIIDVDTILESPSGDNSYGVICRNMSDGSLYSFDIDTTGYYSIIARIGNNWDILVDWVASDAIRTGAGAQNHFRVSCVGDTLSFSVNGDLLAEIQDDRLPNGDIGLSVSTYANGGAKVLFDNVRVREPQP